MNALTRSRAPFQPPANMSEVFDRVFGSSPADFLFGNEGNYPPYNAWLEENGDCVIEIAVSGFSKEELTVEFDGKILLVKGDKEDTAPGRNWIKRGLARRAFIRRFEVRGSCILQSASLKNGILTVVLKDDTQKVTVEITE